VPVRRRRKKTKNRHAGSAPVAAAPNDVWAIDFCFDATTDGCATKITNIVDEHTRESLDGPIDRSVDADKLVDHLDKPAAVRGFPRYLRCDNGPELISNALADWAKDRTEKEKTTITFIEPGAPWQNPWVESFNSRMRDECLEIDDFGSPARSSRDHRRLAARLQPRPAAQLPALPGAGGLRCNLHPPTPVLITAGPVNGGRSSALTSTEPRAWRQMRARLESMRFRPQIGCPH
jgi:hypothetical protein